MNRLQLREPFSALSHLAGAALAIIALVVMILRSQGDAWRVTSFSIYGASLIVLYLSSGIYHSLRVAPVWIERLRKMDHIGIFILIAGTYTPVCLVPLRGGWGWSIFGIVWGIAAIGISAILFWRRMPIWFDLVLYLVMGWIALIAIGPISHLFSGAALAWLLGGGILYTVGAVVFATERPRLWPGIFGAHDLWHLFVLAGSAAHFMMMLSFVSP